jgi:hypothetical protein
VKAETSQAEQLVAKGTLFRVLIAHPNTAIRASSDRISAARVPYRHVFGLGADSGAGVGLKVGLWSADCGPTVFVSLVVSARWQTAPVISYHFAIGHAGSWGCDVAKPTAGEFDIYRLRM